VCLRNDHNASLLNGSQWDTLECSPVDEDTMWLTVQDSENEANVTTVLAHRHVFEDRELSPWEVKEAQQFDFAYALTVHKAQGSQWPNVMIIDESGCFRQDSRKWLYTALTRASESVTVVQ
jgi:exodeoxyribonuclease-5